MRQKNTVEVLNMGPGIHSRPIKQLLLCLQEVLLCFGQLSILFLPHPLLAHFFTHGPRLFWDYPRLPVNFTRENCMKNQRFQHEDIFLDNYELLPLNNSVAISYEYFPMLWRNCSHHYGQKWQLHNHQPNVRPLNRCCYRR